MTDRYFQLYKIITSILVTNNSDKKDPKPNRGIYTCNVKEGGQEVRIEVTEILQKQ